MTRRWGFSGVLACTVPCVFGILAGLIPICFPMVLSRARAERRELIITEEYRGMRNQLDGKPLTGPQAVLQGPAPNLAMLNPVLDGNEYEENYAEEEGLGRTTSSLEPV